MSTQENQSVFKNKMGTRYLRGLFYETMGEDKTSVVYTLKENDHMGYVSLYRLYMDEGDLTEWSFATKYLDGWEHWEMLTQSSWFKPYVERWRRELETRKRGEALRRIEQVAQDDKSPNSYHANKFLLEGSWKPAGEGKRGRPTKVAIQQEAHRIASDGQQVASDFERVLGVRPVYS